MSSRQSLLLSYYFLLMPVWVGLVAAMMVADLDGGSWLSIPFGLTLIVASTHLAYFRREHAEISRRFFPQTLRPKLIISLVAAFFGVFGLILLVAGLWSL